MKESKSHSRYESLPGEPGGYDDSQAGCFLDYEFGEGQVLAFAQHHERAEYYSAAQRKADEGPGSLGEPGRGYVFSFASLGGRYIFHFFRNLNLLFPL